MRSLTYLFSITGHCLNKGFFIKFENLKKADIPINRVVHPDLSEL